MRKKRLALVLAVALLACAVVPAGGLAADEGADAGYYIYDNGGLPKTARSFLAEINHEDEDVTAILLRDGDAVDPAALVATGDTLALYDFDEVLVGEQVVVVVGDVLGTGKAGLSQIARIAAAMYGDDPLEGAYLRAADISGSGELDLTDLVRATEEYRALQQGGESELDAKEVPVYVITPNIEMPTTFYFADGETDIPYISASDAASILGALLGVTGGHPAIDTARTGSVIEWTRDNGAVAELDFDNDTIYFSNYNRFVSVPYAGTDLDILSTSGVGEDGETRFFTRPAGSFQRTGLPIQVDLADHGIEMLMDEDGEGYLPLQTYADLFLAPRNFTILYNGEAAFVIAGGNLGALEDMYYSAPQGPRSPALAEYAYNELCLALEMFYGLKEQHNIRSFDTLFQQTGLVDQLKSPDATESATAISTLCMGYLADLHSAYRTPSCLAGKDAEVHPEEVSPTVRQSLSDAQVFSEARDAAFPDGVPGYQEVGNTAYVTFDAFRMPSADTDYYQDPPTADAEDTVGLIMYAHSRIMREDSPIENVVIDLSNNGGGTADAAIFVAGWFLGGEMSLNLNDTLTEAQASTMYGVDVNADGTVDEADSVSSKNLYCLISPNSFSCGNLVPAVFKGSNKVTLLGRASGGGACVVQPLAMADGTILQLSGPMRISSVSNGSYYDVDKGIEPDVTIVNVENFYNREALTERINGLFR